MASVHHQRRFVIPGYQKGLRNETIEEEVARAVIEADLAGNRWYEDELGGLLYIKRNDGQWLEWCKIDTARIALEPTGSARPQRTERDDDDRQAGGNGTRGQMSVERSRGLRVPSPARSRVSQGAPRAGTP